MKSGKENPFGKPWYYCIVDTLHDEHESKEFNAKSNDNDFFQGVEYLAQGFIIGHFAQNHMAFVARISHKKVTEIAYKSKNTQSAYLN